MAKSKNLARNLTIFMYKVFSYRMAMVLTVTFCHYADFYIIMGNNTKSFINFVK
jgi:hypothetical protein